MRTIGSDMFIIYLYSCFSFTLRRPEGGDETSRNLFAKEAYFWIQLQPGDKFVMSHSSFFVPAIGTKMATYIELL